MLFLSQSPIRPMKYLMCISKGKSALNYVGPMTEEIFHYIPQVLFKFFNWVDKFPSSAIDCRKDFSNWAVNSNFYYYNNKDLPTMI